MKQIGFLSLLITAVLLLTMSLPVGAAGPKTPAAPVPAVAAVPAPAPAAAMPERHPHIAEALEAMRSAKHHLESAEHDFRGHRAKAIEHLSRAIREAEICMSEP
jgi:exonuclease VII large subunit